MTRQYTADELNTLDSQDLSRIVLAQQEQISSLRASYEKLIEQIRIANSQRFGRRSEKMDVIDGQLSLFNDPEFYSDPKAEEPQVEEVVQSYKRKSRKASVKKILPVSPKRRSLIAFPKRTWTPSLEKATGSP